MKRNPPVPILVSESDPESYARAIITIRSYHPSTPASFVIDGITVNATAEDFADALERVKKMHAP